MSNKDEAIMKIESFLTSDHTGLLLTGSNQYEKHRLVMALLEKNFSGAHILFRINSMQNIPDPAFLGWVGIRKPPKSGQALKIGHNYYEFDSLFNQGTWNKTSQKFDFAICYPIDALAAKKDCKPVEELYEWKQIEKVFLCSWYDRVGDGYSFLDEYYDQHVTYDLEV